MSRKLSSEEFEHKANRIHNNRFVYFGKYTLTTVKIPIECKTHGIFLQSPASHLKGSGCPECGRNGDHKKTLDVFIEESVKIHNGLYSYPNTIYNGAGNIVDIECKKHGSFWQQPTVHLKGSGCPECANVKRRTPEEYIIAAKLIHPDLIYDNTVYVNTIIKVEIECKTHGIFFKNPTKHLRGGGCQKCSVLRSTFGYYMKPDASDANDICYRYNIRVYNDKEEFYKWGISKVPKQRFNKLSSTSGYSVEVIDMYVDTRYNCWKLEQKILNKYRRRKTIYKPLITFNGSCECYIK